MSHHDAAPQPGLAAYVSVVAPSNACPTSETCLIADQQEPSRVQLISPSVLAVNRPSHRWAAAESYDQLTDPSRIAILGAAGPILASRPRLARNPDSLAQQMVAQHGWAFAVRPSAGHFNRVLGFTRVVSPGRWNPDRRLRVLHLATVPDSAESRNGTITPDPYTGVAMGSLLLYGLFTRGQEEGVVIDKDAMDTSTELALGAHDIYAGKTYRVGALRDILHEAGLWLAWPKEI